MNSMANPQEGWYPDPHDKTQVRWWDGDAWTDHVLPYAQIAGRGAEQQSGPAREAAAQTAAAEGVADDATRATPVVSVVEDAVGRAGGLGTSGSSGLGSSAGLGGVGDAADRGLTTGRGADSGPAGALDRAAGLDRAGGAGQAEGASQLSSTDQPGDTATSSAHPDHLDSVSEGNGADQPGGSVGHDGSASESAGFGPNNESGYPSSDSGRSGGVVQTPATVAMRHTPADAQQDETDPVDAPTRAVTRQDAEQPGAAGQHAGAAWQQPSPVVAQGSAYGPELKGTWSDDDDAVGGGPGQHSWQGQVGAGELGFARLDLPGDGQAQRAEQYGYPVDAAHQHPQHGVPEGFGDDQDSPFDRAAQDAARGYRVVGDELDTPQNEAGERPQHGTVYGTPGGVERGDDYFAPGGVPEDPYAAVPGGGAGDGVWGEMAYPEQSGGVVNPEDAATTSMQLPPGVALPGDAGTDAWGDRTGPFGRRTSDFAEGSTQTATPSTPDGVAQAMPDGTQGSVADAALAAGAGATTVGAFAAADAASDDGEEQRQRMAEQTRNARLRELDASADRFEAEAQTALYELHLLNEENVQEENTLAEAIRLAAGERLASESDVRSAETALRETRDAVSDLSAKVDAAQAKVEQAQVSSADAARREQEVASRAEELLKQAEERRREALARVEQTADVAKRARAAARAAAAGDYVPEPESWRKDVLASAGVAGAVATGVAGAHAAGGSRNDDADSATQDADSASTDAGSASADAETAPVGSLRDDQQAALGGQTSGGSDPAGPAEADTRQSDGAEPAVAHPMRPQRATDGADSTHPGGGAPSVTPFAASSVGAQGHVDLNDARQSADDSNVQQPSDGATDHLAVDTVASLAATPAGIDDADVTDRFGIGDGAGSAMGMLPVVAPGAGSHQQVDMELPTLAPHDATTVDTNESHAAGGHMAPRAVRPGESNAPVVGRALDNQAVERHSSAVTRASESRRSAAGHVDDQLESPAAVWAVATSAADTEVTAAEPDPEQVSSAEADTEGRSGVRRQPDEVDAAARVVVEGPDDPFGSEGLNDGPGGASGGGAGGDGVYSSRRPDGGGPMTAALDGITPGVSGGARANVTDVRQTGSETSRYSGGAEHGSSGHEPSANLDSGALGLPVRTGPRGGVAWEDDESPEPSGVMTVYRPGPTPEPPVRPTQPVPRRSAGGLSVALPRDSREPAELEGSDDETLNVMLPDTDAARQAALDGLTVGQFEVSPVQASDYPADEDSAMSPTAAHWLQDQPKDLHAAVVGVPAASGSETPVAGSDTALAVKRPGGKTSSYQLGSRMRRFVAYVLDGVLIAGMLGAVSFPVLEPLLAAVDKLFGGSNPLVQLEPQESMALGVIVIGWVALTALYETLLVRFNKGSTVGHMLVGLRVAPREGADTVRMGDAFARWFMKYPIAWLLNVVGVFNFAWCLWDDDRQCWHDKAAGTAVIKRPGT